jgi:tetratricopeptide (TPR) repeat protein
MTVAILSPRLSLSGDEFKLSDSRCVRWFLGALQLLHRFDETASRDSLKEAEKLLKQCVTHYPKDLLPKFYLGITHRILGDMDQDDVIELFRGFTTNPRFEVRASATYNLAAAYIETYRNDLYQKGIDLLDGLAVELKKDGAPIGQPAWLYFFLAFFGVKGVRVEQLYYQSLETHDYFDIHLNLWEKRWSEDASLLRERAAVMRVRLDERVTHLEQHRAFLGEQAAEIWAWHWNNLGTIEESLAAVALRDGEADPAGPDAVRGERAIKAYYRALEVNPRFDSARANLGRVHFELTHNLGTAVDIFTEALKGAEDVNYNNYWLGVIWTLRGDKAKALSHFKHAPAMLERRERMLEKEEQTKLTWNGARKILVYELIKAHRREKAIDLLRKLEKEAPGDKYVKEKIAELTRET